MCRSKVNREGAATRDTVETFVAMIRKHSDDISVVVAMTQAISQMMLGLKDHPEQFSRDVVQSVLDSRKTHPESEELLFWLLALVNNIAGLDNDLSVWLTRLDEGMPLLLEARRLRLKGVFNSDGPGACQWPVCLEVSPAKHIR